MEKGLDAGLPAFSPFPTMYSGVVSVKKDFQGGGGGGGGVCHFGFNL